MNAVPCIALLFGSALYAVSQFVPFSLSGAALPCVAQIGSFQSIEAAITRFSTDNKSWKLGDITNYLYRSDFEIRNINAGSSDPQANGQPPDNMFSVVFRANDVSPSCFVPSLIRRFPPGGSKLIILRVKYDGGPTYDAIVYAVTNNYGE